MAARPKAALTALASQAFATIAPSAVSPWQEALQARPTSAARSFLAGTMTASWSQGALTSPLDGCADGPSTRAS